MSANIRELLSAVAIHKQTGIAVLPSAADFITMSKVNAAASNVNYINETDALDIGKGDEWARQVISSHIDAAVDFEKYASSEIGAFIAVFGLGSWVETADTGTSQYVAQPLDPVMGGIELPYTAYVEKVRTGAATVIDRALRGAVVQSWSLELTSGPGRQNTKMNFQLVGTGDIVQPSGVLIPTTPMFEHAVKPTLFTIGAENYVTERSFVSLSLTYNNNIRLDQGCFPGSGYDSSLYQKRGRLENGDRTITLQLVARMRAGSTEFDKLKAKTHGPTSVLCNGETIAGTPPSPNDFKVDFPDSIISAAVIGDDAGILTVQVDVTPVRLPGQPIMFVTVNTPLAGVGTDAT